jgi:hypothetical protein
MNPIVFFPALRRSSLMRLTIPAKMGVEELVPPPNPNFALLKMVILSPLNSQLSIVQGQVCIEISDGYIRLQRHRDI